VSLASGLEELFGVQLTGTFLDIAPSES